MDSAQTQLANRRLALGITNVGFWVLAACGGLAWLVIHEADACTLRADGLILVGAVVVQAGFDFVGGFLLMPPPKLPLDRFLLNWLRGTLVHTLVLGSVGLLSYASFRLVGGFIPAILLATMGLVLARRWMLYAVGGVVSTVYAYHEEQILVAEGTDSAFTGGITWRGAHTTSLLPATWLRDLPAGDAAAESRRRRWQIARGLPGRALLLILGMERAGGRRWFAWPGIGRARPGGSVAPACLLDDTLDVW